MAIRFLNSESMQKAIEGKNMATATFSSRLVQTQSGVPLIQAYRSFRCTAHSGVLPLVKQGIFNVDLCAKQIQMTVEK